MYIQCDYKPVLNNIKPNQFVGSQIKTITKILTDATHVKAIR